ncbi:hypothetical protein C8J57DRAFT_1706037 [Mycena rebaudengoi]|nr:hypothetical protein C8J57DRAFT_1706037 [Mycena rebaudengoi]
MSRVAPNLLYLTIYNPTLRPSGPVDPDDEDAEEQAHILFYTSKERAVSRDRMLRQIGLAKALVSFSDMFNADDPCNNVHSQARTNDHGIARAGLLDTLQALTLRKRLDLPRISPKPKGKEKEKPKAADAQPAPVVYDYHEYSVHDEAVQTDILRGYERFKLRHGSFASILSSLGQEALELQLERFFTVWAWTWDLEAGPEFGEHLGTPLHPMYRSLAPLVDDFIFPATRRTMHPIRPPFPEFLLTLLPAVSDTTVPPPVADNSTIKAPKVQEASPLEPQRPRGSPPKPEDDGKGFLGMNVKMDMPKWNWAGYLTFGKGGKRPPELFSVTPHEENKGRPIGHTWSRAIDAGSGGQKRIGGRHDGHATVTTKRDGGYRVDGLKRLSRPKTTIRPFPQRRTMYLRFYQRNESNEPAPAPEPEPELPPTPEPEPPATPEPEPAQFSSTTVHLANPESPQATRRRRLFYLIRDQVLIALLGLDDSGNQLEPDASILSPLADDAFLLRSYHQRHYQRRCAEELGRSAPLRDEDPCSRRTVPDFESRSAHLYNAKRLLRARCVLILRDAISISSNATVATPDISEVFSRGQNPQHWHVARRGLPTDQGTADGEVYLEVFRKETSLTDVDNALAGVIRKSGLAAQA